MFGKNVIVKLDLFHAVQQITKHLPKRHPLYSLCVADLRLVFRQSADFGTRQLSDTPEPDQIMRNLDEFVKKSKQCDINGWKILTENALKQIKNLQNHVKQGCLSQIPSGAGTNRNECLHRHIRPHFSRTRMGLPMALALITSQV